MTPAGLSHTLNLTQQGQAVLSPRHLLSLLTMSRLQSSPRGLSFTFYHFISPILDSKPVWRLGKRENFSFLSWSLYFLTFYFAPSLGLVNPNFWQVIANNFKAWLNSQTLHNTIFQISFDHFLLFIIFPFFFSPVQPLHFHQENILGFLKSREFHLYTVGYWLNNVVKILSDSQLSPSCEVVLQIPGWVGFYFSD